MKNRNFNRRSSLQKVKDFLFFPIRGLMLFENDRWGLSSTARDRFDYVRNEVEGYCLDVGCGKYNRFINEYMDGKGVGIDVYKYEGLSGKNIVKDITVFPFKENTFDAITFIANIGHVPISKRDKELSEAYRCLKKGGKIVITSGNPIVEMAVHKWVELYDKIFKTKYDVDNERGMEKEESYYVLDQELIERLRKVGFVGIKKKMFWTEWGLNHLLVGYKD
jgi:SAM-dependent methyltransferase